MASAEALLISAVVQTGEVTRPISAGVTQECFTAHRPEWAWIEGFAAHHGQCPSKASFCQAWPEFPLLVTDEVDHATNQVLDEHVRNRLTAGVKRALEFLADGDSEKAMSSLSSDIAEVTLPSEQATDAIADPEETYQEAARRVELADTAGIAGIPTGFPTLDERTGGFQPGDLALVAARLGRGKSYLLVRMAVEAVMNGHAPLLISLEQTRTEVAFRIHTVLANKLGYELRNRQLTSGRGLDLMGYRTFLSELPEAVPANFRVVDGRRGRISVSQVSAMIERYAPSMVLIDYITLMDKEGHEWQAIAKLSGEVKLVAQRHQIPIVAAAQINRLGEGTTPPSTDKLAQSDALGQDADCVITMQQLHRKALAMRLAKNRAGQDNALCYASFDADKGYIEEVSYDQALDLEEDDS